MTSKEALEKLNTLIWREKHINSERNKTINECINTIKQDLERLEVLEKENKELWENIEKYNHKFASVERKKADLIQENEKLKKVIKIIKRMDIFLNQDEDFKDGSIEICGYLEVSEEVFELLKEVLGNE